MSKRIIVSALSLLLPLVLVAGCSPAAGSASTTPGWAIQGAWTDSCWCKVACPCLFGTKPTEGYCEGASLLEIESGHFGDVSLDGTAAVATYRVGNWAKIFVSDSASPEQVKALAAVIPLAMPFLAKGTLEPARTVPLAVERSEGAIRFSVPETVVELALLESAGGGPIKLHNLPAKGTPFPQFHDHTQYKSVLLEHRSDDRSFSWTGRNGFASRVDMSGGGDAGSD